MPMGRFHGSADEPAGLGDAQMKRIVAGACQEPIGRRGERDIGGLHADLEIGEAVVLENAGVIKCALDHGFGSRSSVPFEEVPFE